MPGDIKTEPNAKIVYNAPFSEKNVYNIRLTNNGARMDFIINIKDYSTNVRDNINAGGLSILCEADQMYR